ncbi:MAG: prepilin-type N-terminal cleavage/methylation domain-containing protein [Planctomycetes bacterium]|nr:prepilin-type N-terminal cleavage/methylation domain-containing protein [Planctomycetota bacterium]
MPQQISQRAFTLIEMMIAIGLGMLVIYTAIAGFRVASQSVTLANRLSLENSLIRAGFQEAHHQMDFWTNLDDPDDATRQRLRGTVTMGTGGGVGEKLNDIGFSPTVGFPFAPMSSIFPANQPMKSGMPVVDSAVPRFSNPLGTPWAPVLPLDGSAPTPANWNLTADSDVGFDPTYAWAPHDPRTWYRGNVIEKERGDDWDSYIGVPVWFGRYGIFTNTDEGSGMAFRAFNPKPHHSDPDSARYQAGYSTTSMKPHRWYGRQILGLSRALGFYGMCDYLPSHTIYSVYTSYAGGRTSPGGIPKYFLPDKGFLIGTGMHEIHGLGLHGLTHAQSFGVCNPANRTVSDTDLVNEHFRYWESDYSTYWNTGNATALQDFMRVTLSLDTLMKKSPIHWPVLSVGVAHYIKSAKFANVARVRWTNPLTGAESELSFTGVGTTLRGARMQRKPGGGWAGWDNRSGSMNDSHLDTP